MRMSECTGDARDQESGGTGACADAALSRSLLSPAQAGAEEDAGAARVAAYELKFLIDDDLARQVEGAARTRLMADPHGDASRGGSYQITSLYLDTAQLDVYHRTPGYKRSKFRVRRYGEADEVYFERKSKRGDLVSKRRERGGMDELARLGVEHGLEGATAWAGEWFGARARIKQLRPACVLTYSRTALIGANMREPIRLTLDREILAARREDWCVGGLSATEAVLRDRVVLELKFAGAMPVLFKELVTVFRLAPGAVSKYRAACEALRLPELSRNGHSAPVGGAVDTGFSSAMPRVAEER